MMRSSERTTKIRSTSNSSPKGISLQPIEMAADQPNHRQSQIVPTTSAPTPFRLPEGWKVEVKPRSFYSANQTPDKYYYEPHTGRKFRSLVSIKRYLQGEEGFVPSTKAPKTEDDGAMNLEVVRRIAYNGKMWKPDELEVARRNKDAIPTAVQHKLSSLLPDGWIIEDVPRKYVLKSDRYFLEPLTGLKFESAKEVRSYLTDKNVKLENFDTSNPPEKVKWKLTSSSMEDKWSPFVEGAKVPDHVKELWRDTFFLGMTGRKRQIPQLTMGEDNSA